MGEAAEEQGRVSDEHDALLDPAVLGALPDLSLEDLRAARDRCVQVETGLSYLRRLVQGSLDIVNRELVRRAEGGEPQDATDLVGDLPEILGEMPRPSGVGRLTRTLEPTELDGDLATEYRGLVGDGVVARASVLDAAELGDLLDQLTALEHRVSERRHDYFERIDALQAELARRYETGEASVDELLRDP